MVLEVRNNKKLNQLFDGWQETLIWSCLQGVMGRLYTTSKEEPVSAMTLLGDFCFLAGMADKELVSFKPEWCEQDFVIMIPQTKEWAALIEEVYGEKAKKVERYAIKKEPNVFGRDRLQQIVNELPSGYELKMMDKELFECCKELDWCRDWVSQYETYEMYQRLGLGVVLLRDGEVVSGASSYSSYQGGIEIEIDTKESYRRNGLALVCGAKLILECLERGWYPSWDAQNLGSVALAEKLGYHFERAYVAYEIEW